MVYTIPFVCHGAKWGFESFETSKALPLPYTYLLLSQGWGERHSALYSELKKCSHGNSFMELLYCGPDFDYRGFVYVCLWSLKSNGFFFFQKPIHNSCEITQPWNISLRCSHFGTEFWICFFSSFQSIENKQFWKIMRNQVPTPS